MKPNILLIALLISGFSGMAFAQAKLEGRIVKVDGTVASTVRVISPGGQSGTTDSRGHFLIQFASLKPGFSFRIIVNSPPGWKVCDPILGLDTAQDMNNQEVRQVVIAPPKSDLLKGPKYVHNLIIYISRQLAEQKKIATRLGVENQELKQAERPKPETESEQTTEQINVLLDKYTNEYDLKKEEVLAAVQSWAQPQPSDDKETQALKEFWNRNYITAGKLAVQSAYEADDELERANQYKLEKSRASIRKFKLGGDSYMKANRWDLARDAYKDLEQRFASRLISKEDFRDAWAENEVMLAYISWGLARAVSFDPRAYNYDEEKGRQYYREAERYALEALTVLTVDRQRELWAQAKFIYGLSHQTPPTIAEVKKYRDESVAALREAQQVFTNKASPQLWLFMQRVIIESSQLDSSDPDNAAADDAAAAKAYGEIVQEYPNDEEALGRAIALYDESVFDFAAAFALEQLWLDRHPADLEVQTDFAARHFTVGRFSECEQRINLLLANPEVAASRKPILRAIEIASLLGEGKTKIVPARMEALKAEINQQPARFGLTCGLRSKYEDNSGCNSDNLAATIKFIQETQKLSHFQDWLIKLFDALLEPDRNVTLASLTDLQVKWLER